MEMSEISFESEDEFSDDLLEEDIQEVADYIREQIVLQKSVSMVNLTNAFKHKQLTTQALKQLYADVRERMEIDRRVSRRQPHENLSDLNLIFEHFCNFNLEFDETSLAAILSSDYLQRKLSVQEILHVRQQALAVLPMDFDEFTEFLLDLTPDTAYRMRLSLEEHVKLHSPFRRFALNLEELDLVEFDEDGLTIVDPVLSCLERGWCLVKLDGNTIFTQDEKEEFMELVDPSDCFFAEFVIA